MSLEQILTTAIRNVAFGLRVARHGSDVEGAINGLTNGLVNALEEKPKRMQMLETELEEAYMHIARLELEREEQEERIFKLHFPYELDTIEYWS